MATLAGCLSKAGSIVSPEDAAAIAEAHDFLVREEGYRRRDAAIEAVQSVLDSAQQHIDQLIAGGPTLRASGARGSTKGGIFKASNAFLAPADVAELGQAVKEHVQNIGQKLGKEALLVLDENGKVLAEGSGRKGSVVVPNRVGLTDPNAHLALHHTHPTNQSLSDADIAVLGNSGADVIWAHTPDDHSFRASLKGPVKEQIRQLNARGDPEAGRNALLRASTAMARTFLPILRQLIYNHHIPYDSALELYDHLVNLGFERAGIIDYDASRTYANMGLTNTAVEEIAGAIQAMANAATRSLKRSGINANPRLPDDRSSEPDIRHVADVAGIFEGDRGDTAGGQLAEGAADRERPVHDEDAAGAGPDEARPQGLRQSGLRYIRNPLELGVPLPKGQKKRKIVDVGKAFDAAHHAEHGRQFFPENSEEDYQRLLTDAAEELRDQRLRENSGEGWYAEDVEKAMDMAALVYPTLARWPSNQAIPYHRDVFLMFAGIFSNGNKPETAFLKSAEAFEAFLKNGQIPVKRSVAARLRGKRPQRSQYKKAGEDIDALTGWSNRNDTNEQQLGLVRWLSQREGSVENAIKWLQMAQPLTAINRAMIDSGLYVTPRFGVREANTGAPAPGALVFGDKLGRYTLTLQGIPMETDESAVIDLWYIRTYRRHIGRLLEGPIGDEGIVGGPTETDRQVVFRMTGDLARMHNMRPEDIQAVLWFYEKRLWQAVGVQTSEGTNSSGARKLLEEKGIPIPAPGERAIPAIDRQGADRTRGAQPRARSAPQGPPSEAPGEGHFRPRLKGLARPGHRPQRGRVLRSTDVEGLLGPAPPFYSAVTNAIENIPMKLGSPAQWMNRIRGAQDVKKEEIDLLGLQEFLANPPKAYGPAPTGPLQSRGYELRRYHDQEGPPSPTGEMAWELFGPDDGTPYSHFPVIEELDGRTEEEAWANAQQIVDNNFEIAPDAPEIKGKVSKQALLDFVRENEITVNEVEKGGGTSRAELHSKMSRLLDEQSQLLREQHRSGRQGLSQAAAEDLWQSIQQRLFAVAEEMDATTEAFERARDSDVQHSGHVQEGGDKNYRELLLTLPPQKARGLEQIPYREPFDDSGHWPEPDVLAWARFNEREANGQRVMYIEEVQSQWHQEGRERGYQDAGRGQSAIEQDLQAVERELEEREPTIQGRFLSFDAKERYWKKHPELLERFDTLTKELTIARQRVPDAPFKQTWPELMMKRLIRYAAENGFDRIAWTPGDVQNKRWSLAKHFSSIEIHPISPMSSTSGKPYKLVANDEHGRALDFPVAGEAEVADHVGRELAAKLFSGENLERLQAGIHAELTGLDMEVGGGPMREFYDKRLANIANKIGRRVGVEVGPITVTLQPEKTITWHTSPRMTTKAKTQETQSLPITPSLRKMAMEKGFPRFMWTSPAGRARAAAQAEAVGVQLDQFAQQILGHRINLEVFTKAWVDAPHAMAAFFSNRHGSDKPVIAINLASTPGEHRLGAVRHEAIHALRDWGVFTKPEWSILVRAAKRVMPMEIMRQDYAYYRDEAANLTEQRFTEMVEEEAVAELFRYWGNGILPSDSTIPVLRIIEKIGQFIVKMVDLVQNVLMSRNAIDLRDALTTFEDAPQIMARIEAGGFKNRPTGFRERPAEIRAKKGSKASVGEMKKGGAAVPRNMNIQSPIGEDALDDKLAGNINLNYLNTDSDIDSIMVAIADIHDKFITARRGVQSHADTARLAKSMGMTEETLLKRKRGEAWNAHRIYAARTLLVASGRDLKAKIAQAMKTESVEDLSKFQQAYTRHVAIQEQIAGLASEAGRALNQFKMMAGDFDFKAAKNLIDSANAKAWASGGGQLTGREALMKLLKMTANMPNDPALNAFTRNSYTATGWDMVREFYINALLTGIGTQIINFLGNAATSHLQILEAVNTAAIGTLRRAAGDRRERVTWGEVGARMAGLIQGYSEGAAAAGKVVWTTEQTFGKHRQMEQGRRKAIPGIIGKVVRAPTERLMAGADELFKGINFHAELSALAYRQAYIEEGLRGQALKARVKELRDTPPEDMIDKAVHFADYQTFQNNLGSIAGSAMRLREQVPVVGWLAIPFMKTPINLFKYIQERSPGGNLFHKEARLDLLGKNGKIAQDNAMAKLMTGSGLILMTIGLIGAGLLTGGGSDDPEEKDRDIADGWQPYSFRLPGSKRWFSYQRGDPFAILMGITADLYEHNYKLNEDDWDKMPAKLLWAAFNTLMEKTWARGPSDLIEAIGSRDEKQLDRYLRGVIASPIPTLSAQIARTNDPVLRDARSTMDSIMNRVPGQKEKMPPRRDIWGEERRYEQLHTGLGSWADFMLNLSNPVYTSTMKHDPLIQMMREIGYAPSRPGKEINGHELTAQQYSEFSQLIGNKAKVMATRRVGNLKPIKTREERFRDIWTDARKQAVSEMKRRYPEMLRPPKLPDVELPVVPEWSTTE